jgi:uncharacterized phage protein (TIGR02220 family)
MKDSFNTFRSTFNALLAFPAEDMKKAYRMMGEYAMDGIEPEPEESSAYGLFLSIRPLVDRSIKRSAAGRAGALANLKQNRGKAEANLKQNRGTSEPKKKEEIRNNKNNKNILSGNPDHVYQYEEIIEYLNQKAGTSFRSRSTDSRKHIHARLDEGFTLQDFKTVIDKKVADWKGTDMAKYLRPATLFGSKFEGYLNQQAGDSVRKNGFNNFQSSGTDWDAVADLIMEEDRNG